MARVRNRKEPRNGKANYLGGVILSAAAFQAERRISRASLRRREFGRISGSMTLRIREQYREGHDFQSCQSHSQVKFGFSR